MHHVRGTNGKRVQTLKKQGEAITRDNYCCRGTKPSGYQIRSEGGGVRKSALDA